MQREAFDKLVEETIEKTGKLLIQKGDEYAGDADRLMNFKRNAEKNDQTVLECWQVYIGKHQDAINSYMKRVKATATRAALEELVWRTEDLLEKLPKRSARSISDQAKLLALADPETFRENVIINNPRAMQEVDKELSEPIEGRFHDVINYCFLGLAIIKELRE